MATLGRLIGGFITILVGVTILPTVANEVKAAQSGNCSDDTICGSGNRSTNVSGATSTVTGLITLFFALGILAAGISIAVGGLRDAGLM